MKRNLHVSRRGAPQGRKTGGDPGQIQKEKQGICQYFCSAEMTGTDPGNTQREIKAAVMTEMTGSVM